eukprot:scaffold102004_cov45-Phaeocystis_antarctica.AAC.1
MVAARARLASSRLGTAEGSCSSGCRGAPGGGSARTSASLPPPAARLVRCVALTSPTQRTSCGCASVAGSPSTR